MVRLLFLFLLVNGYVAHSQNNYGYIGVRGAPDPAYRDVGVLSASATFTPGIMLNRDRVNYHLHGFAEYHFNRSVSVKSDSYLYLNSPSEEFPDLKMIRSNFGLFYHLNQMPGGHWDVKIGLLPGVTYAENAQFLYGKEIRTTSLAPSLSAAIGFDYFVWKYFHFFSQVSFVHSTLRGLPYGSERMDEMLFSFGLGFQIPTRK